MFPFNDNLRFADLTGTAWYSSKLFAVGATAGSGSTDDVVNVIDDQFSLIVGCILQFDQMTFLLTRSFGLSVAITAADPAGGILVPAHVAAAPGGIALPQPLVTQFPVPLVFAPPDPIHTTCYYEFGAAATPLGNVVVSVSLFGYRSLKDLSSLGMSPDNYAPHP